MAENRGSLAIGMAFLLRRKLEAEFRRFRKEYTASRIEFWKKHQKRVEKRIEELEAELPRKPKKKIQKVDID
ncbi:hypothetical protein SAMN02745216_04874 [Desulfatibacillum alkenivorans DSM 16219]|jgi:chaperonin cofactor prefoldin|uniref:Uncharacterized protein n=1 Tax=Desulfatibacillum alkenivorans DSM 16219 TaxID=1121393 RepID=A0A1M6Z023_9BACT|nr:hypothetical protein [Desulfatibacillum alkenivorans]SHL23702.1 hypothetical protein SAMN02745216_04874 [Desulfatibacillum alkenivorans DSM 16219]